MSGPVEAFGRRWKRAWLEDECTLRDPDAERWPAAWKRLFDGEPPGDPRETRDAQPATYEDWGDSDAYLIGDVMMVSSFDGHSLWVLEPTAADAQGPAGERP